MTSAEWAALGRQGIGASSQPPPAGDTRRPANGTHWTYDWVFPPGTHPATRRLALTAFHRTGAYAPERKMIRP